MIAVLGYIMPEVFRFPGCEEFKHGLGAFETIPLEGWVQLVALVGAHEAQHPTVGTWSPVVALWSVRWPCCWF